MKKIISIFILTITLILGAELNAAQRNFAPRPNQGIIQNFHRNQQQNLPTPKARFKELNKKIDRILEFLPQDTQEELYTKINQLVKKYEPTIPTSTTTKILNNICYMAAGAICVTMFTQFIHLMA